jgi:tRNA modification GTPase
MNPSTDTIAAIATPPGHGGVGMVRVSGPAVPAIAHALFGKLPRARLAGLHDFRAADGALIDSGLVLYFPAPASFTGEHVLELHGHGGPVVLDLVLARVLELGARNARPGEFSERAFLNGKLDLAQAEAIADLIDELRSYVEAALDFPDEELDLLANRQVVARLDELQHQLEHVYQVAHHGQLLRDGMTLVICGRPNAGKSSLLNALAGHDAAIVTEVPGTTRDVLREHIQIDGLPLHIIDTAGLHDSPDPVEQHGMQRTRRELGNADRALLVIDDQDGFTDADAAILEALPAGVAHTRIFNKIDLSGRSPGAVEDMDAVAISARTGAGLAALRGHLKHGAGFSEQPEGGFSARRRHLDALERATRHVREGARQLERQAGELLAEELRQAQQALNEITGEFTSDDLLGRIFSDFCIGK